MIAQQTERNSDISVLICADSKDVNDCGSKSTVSCKSLFTFFGNLNKKK